MSVYVGDAVLVQLGDLAVSEFQRIGLVEYIGDPNVHNNIQLIGINLVEPFQNGHDGMIDGINYFKTRPGHGIYVGISNIIKTINASELTLKMQDMLILFKQRINEYIIALSERDEYIAELKSTVRCMESTVRNLRTQLNFSSVTNSNTLLSNDIFLTSINELAISPPPLNKSDEEQRTKFKTRSKKSRKKRKRKVYTRNKCIEMEKHSEYTKLKRRGQKNSYSSDWIESDESELSDVSSDEIKQYQEEMMMHAKQSPLPLEHISIPIAIRPTATQSLPLLHPLDSTSHTTPYHHSPYPQSPYHSPPFVRSGAPSPYSNSQTLPLPLQQMEFPKLNNSVQSAPPPNQSIHKKRRSLHGITPTLELHNHRVGVRVGVRSPIKLDNGLLKNSSV